MYKRQTQFDFVSRKIHWVGKLQQFFLFLRVAGISSFVEFEHILKAMFFL